MNDDQSAIPPAMPERELDLESRPVPFSRTWLVVGAHWVFQAAICALAQIDIEKLSDLCILLITADAFLHIVILCSFTGMVLWSRFLFSWPFAFTLLSFAVSILFSSLSINRQYKTWLGGQELLVAILHFFVAIAAGVCLVIWPVIRWQYELTRTSKKEIDDEKNQFQFGMGLLMSLILILAFVIATVYRSNFAQNIQGDGMADRVYAGIFCVLWLVNLYLIFAPKLPFEFLVHLNFAAFSVILVSYFFIMGPDTVSPVARTGEWLYIVFYVVFSLHFYLSCLAYRWAGWRIVKYGGHNKSVYKYALIKLAALVAKINK
jgi:hypothetical protein